jgi:DNA-binding CsgD family transcriptional regulator
MQYVLEAFAEAEPPRLVDAKGVVLLSQREHEVVHCVTEGLTNREIATRLKLSEHTVKNYIFKIFEKLGVSTRVEMVLYAFSQRASQTSKLSAYNPSSSNDPDAVEVDRLRKAAEQGDPGAQFMLGKMYRDGTGVNKDRIAAYTWFLLALKTSSELAAAGQGALVRLAGLLRADEIAKAEDWVTEWLPENGFREKFLGRVAPRSKIAPRKSTLPSATDNRLPQAADRGSAAFFPQDKAG